MILFAEYALCRPIEDHLFPSVDRKKMMYLKGLSVPVPNMLRNLLYHYCSVDSLPNERRTTLILTAFVFVLVFDPRGLDSFALFFAMREGVGNPQKVVVKRKLDPISASTGNGAHDNLERSLGPRSRLASVWFWFAGRH